ncbi:MAG TPA: cation diffusion facilitator family transporter [Angustibacter sp.]|nr:cation diffusion facilitator family transporter [Angustibacter sp.]
MSEDGAKGANATKRGKGRDEGGESTGTVIIALLANAGIAVAKGVAAVVSGSASMAAETGHSVADTANELLLLVALKRSQQPADRRRPFGYGAERFFWSFVAAVSIFVSGAVFAGIEGLRQLLGGGEESGGLLLSSIVLGIGFLLEGISWLRAVKGIRGQMREERKGLRELLRSTDDPTVKTVFYEDSAALIGILLAFGGVYGHHLTGSSWPDAVASLLIAALLAAIAFLLARTNKNLLVGSAADPRLVQAVAQWLGDREEVDAVVDLLTERIGTDQVLVCARLDYGDGLDARQVEASTVEMNRGLREEFGDVVEVFLEPVPKDDERLRERVRQRYGDDVLGRLDNLGRRPR